MKLIARLKPFYSIDDFFATINIFKKNPIKSFEQQFATKFQNKYGVMFAHGRSGLYALLKIWNLNDSEIICPAYTCVVVPNAIVLSGNIPVFIDCAQDSWNMDLELLEKNITQNTRCIISSHIFGYPFNVKKVQQIVEKAEKKYNHKIYIIQDVAHSFGAKWDNILVTQYGDASIFGMNISKVMNSIFGGMVITNQQTIYNKLIQWRNLNTKYLGFKKELKRFIYFCAVNIAFNSYIYGFVNWLERIGALDRFVKYYEEDKIDFPNDWNEYPANIEARVGLNQLKKYDKIINNRIIVSKQWQKKLYNQNITFLPAPKGTTYSHCTGLVNNRGEWLNYYRKQGIQLGIIIEYSIPYMKAYQKYKKGEYPISLRYSKQTINFPNYISKDLL